MLSAPHGRVPSAVRSCAHARSLDGTLRAVPVLDPHARLFSQHNTPCCVPLLELCDDYVPSSFSSTPPSHPILPVTIAPARVPLPLVDVKGDRPSLVPPGH